MVQTEGEDCGHKPNPTPPALRLTLWSPLKCALCLFLHWLSTQTSVGKGAINIYKPQKPCSRTMTYSYKMTVSSHGTRGRSLALCSISFYPSPFFQHYCLPLCLSCFSQPKGEKVVSAGNQPPRCLLQFLILCSLLPQGTGMHCVAKNILGK